MAVALLAACSLIVGLAFVVSSRNSDHDDDPRSGARKSPKPYLRGINIYTLMMNRNRSMDEGELGEPLQSYEFLRSRGITTVRLAVPWELLQPVIPGRKPRKSLDRPLDRRYVSVIKQEIAKIRSSGISVVFDLHSGCSYPQGIGDRRPETLYCGEGLPKKNAVNIWKLISREFRNEETIVAYDIFNETRLEYVPFKIYKSYTQAVVDELRKLGDDRVIWVESMCCKTTLATLATPAAGGAWIRDPLNRITYSQHFYPGKSASQNLPYGAASYARWLELLGRFAEWCKRYGVHCSVGEVGWPSGASQEKWPSSALSWNSLGEEFYQIADHYQLDVMYFGASSERSSYLWAYDGSLSKFPAPGINRGHTQSTVIEAHLAM